MQALDVFSILQQLPPPLCQAAEVRFSIRVYAALAAGDIRAYLRMHAEAGWRYWQLMNIQLGKVGEKPQTLNLLSTTSYGFVPCKCMSLACSAPTVAQAFFVLLNLRIRSAHV